MPLVLFTIYLAGCVVCGIMGRNTTVGFMGHFLLAAFLTPIIDFLFQAAGRPNTRLVDKNLSRKP